MKLKALSAVIVAAVVGLAVILVPDSAKASVEPGPRSGLPWISGAYLEHNASKIGPYETGRGKKLDAIVVFPSRETQTSMLNTWWLPAVKPVTDNGGYAVITVPLWAQNMSVNYDTTYMFTQLALQIKNNLPADRTIVRLGWEMNLPGQYWNVTSGNRATWVARFRNAATVLRNNAPGVEIAFNPNEGPSQTSLTDIGSLATELSAAFDWVGPDYYNWYSQVDTQAQWDARYKASYGMKYWEDFAYQMGKGFMVPEWGGAPAVNNSTAVFYTQKMVERFAAMSRNLRVLDAHFNEPATYIRNSLWNPQQMPAMATALRNALAAQTVTPSPTPSISSPSPVPSC